MTATDTDTFTAPDGTDFDFSDVTPETITAEPGPLGRSRGTRTPGTRRKTGVRKLESLQKKLSGEMFQAGAMIGMGLPVTGYYTCNESDTFTKAVVELASMRPEWVEALEHLAAIGPGITVGRFALGFGASVAVDRGRSDPEKKFMHFLGVNAAWKAVTEPGERVEGSAYEPPPQSVFVPVS